MEESPSWEADSIPGGEETPRMLYNSVFITVCTVIESNTEPDESTAHSV